MGKRRRCRQRRRRGLFCHWCNRPLVESEAASETAATRDHLLPQCQGGTFKVWACFSCNNLKGNMMPQYLKCIIAQEWAVFRAMNPEWWKTHPRKPGRRVWG